MIQKIINIAASAILLTGLVLMVIKIVVDSEPGAIPTLLVIVGTVGLFHKKIIRVLFQKQLS